MVQVSGETSASAVSLAISAPSCRRAHESFDRAHCRPLGIQPNAMPWLGGQDDIRKYQRRLVEVTANCAEMKGSLRKVAAKHKAEKRQRRQSEMIALNVLCQTDGNVAACQRYLTLRLGAHRPTDVQQSIEDVKSTFADMSPQERTDLFDGSLPESYSKPARLATAFLRELKLANWIEDVNMIQHIAPVTVVVLKNACQMGCVPSEPTAATNKSRKQWLRRWSRRWGAVMGSIARREHVPAGVIHAKAFLTRNKIRWVHGM